MGAFAEAQTCRRLVLLNYFGEGKHENCGNCDICLDPPKRYDGLEDARKALSCVYRVGQRFGLGYIVEVLRGSNNQRIREYGTISCRCTASAAIKPPNTGPACCVN